MKKIQIILACVFTIGGVSFSIGQMIHNPDFELYTICPVQLAEYDKVNYWTTVVATPDYYNCTFLDSPAGPTSGGAQSGLGYMGFATEIGPILSTSEAIGQNLPVALSGGQTYNLSFHAKKTLSGPNSDNCGGIQFYGFTDTLPTFLNFPHVSQLSFSELLGETSIIQNTVWEMYTMEITPSSDLKAIAFTLDITQATDCSQYTFLDNVQIAPKSEASTELLTTSKLQIGPNPSKGMVNVRSESLINRITVFAMNGTRMLEAFPQSMEKSIEFSSPGMYVLEVETEGHLEQRKLHVY